MRLPNCTNEIPIDEIVQGKSYEETVEIKVGWLVALFSDLSYLQGRVEGMEETLKLLRLAESLGGKSVRSESGI